MPSTYWSLCCNRETWRPGENKTHSRMAGEMNLTGIENYSHHLDTKGSSGLFRLDGWDLNMCTRLGRQSVDRSDGTNRKVILLLLRVRSSSRGPVDSTNDLSVHLWESGTSCADRPIWIKRVANASDDECWWVLITMILRKYVVEQRTFSANGSWGGEIAIFF